MASPFDRLRGMAFKPPTPEQTAAQEAFETGPLADPDEVKRELEALGIRWDFVEGAVALVKTQTKALRDYAGSNQRGLAHLEQVVGTFAEHFLRNYTPGNNVEPIGVNSFVDSRVTEYLGKKLAPKLVQGK